MEQRLYLSWRATASRTAKSAAGAIPILVVAVFFWHFDWMTFLVIGAVPLLLFALSAKKGIVLDSTGFRLVPLVPLVRETRVRWDDVDELVSHQGVDPWVTYSRRRRKLRRWGRDWFRATFALEPGAPPLSSGELVELMNRWRGVAG